MENQNSNFTRFMLLWAGEVISAVGSGLTSFGLGVYVFQQTGSAGSMALVTLLAVGDIKLLLVIDIGTFFPTVPAAALVRKGILAKSARTSRATFGESLRQGWGAITGNRGILILVVVSSVITCFMGCFQILAQPLILDLVDSATLGVGETICACGMLVSGVFLGVKGIRSGYVRILGGALLFAGIMMVGFGIWENMIAICLFGFLFFATLPFANNCLDYLIRTNIENELQGRAWGVIGFLSQIGYVVAYGTAGAAADGIAAGLNIGVGRGAAAVVMMAGGLLAVTALLLSRMKSVRTLEEPLCLKN